PSAAPGFGTVAMAFTNGAAAHNAAFDDWQQAWAEFAERGNWQSPFGFASPESAPGKTHNGALASSVDVAPGKTVEVPFFLAWRYPNKYNGEGVRMGNHYATLWPDARAVLRDVIRDFPVLRKQTERFRSVFYDSTLPYWMLDALTSQM